MSFDLASAARAEMLQDGFHPDFPPEADAQLATIAAAPPPRASDGVRDLRNLLWSSIDNDSSRDLDQIEYAERVAGGIRLLVGIADVDSAVAIGSPIDQHAAAETTSVYTGIRTFPMLPERLSTGLTSLNEDSDRLALILEVVVAPDGTASNDCVYRGLVRNQAQLTYSATGGWLEGGPAPSKIAASKPLQDQLKLQDEAAVTLRRKRQALGALNFDRIEAMPVIADGQVQDIRAQPKNHASKLIEDFMIAGNEVMARALLNGGVSSIRRVVKSPERWPRIVEIAAGFGEKLPVEADSAALNVFLQKRKAADPIHYADLSLAMIKLMGPGEYVLARAGESDAGHFALAAHDYTHSTAPNRRFADLVTQRLIKSVLAKQPAPYSDEQLDGIARNCTLKEDAARKVERNMNKRIAAVAFHSRIGQNFSAIVTGVSSKGVFVRVLDPPVEGRLMRGFEGADVGDQVPVKLLNTDAQRGFIDFGRV